MLANRARLRLEKRRARRKRTEPVIPDLGRFIPKASPTYATPTHLAPAMERLQRFREQPFEFVFSVPPRHGKTVLILHFIVWVLLQYPELSIAYVSYSEEQAQSVGRIGLRIAEAAGLKLTRTAAGSWQTAEGGGVLWTGVGGALTGKGFHIALVDDPVKNRLEAESPVHRQRAYECVQSDIITRLEPGGSIAVIQTRWHDDDVAGRLSKGDEDEEVDAWETINIPAIQDEGSDHEVALWPERYPLEALHRRRRKVGPYAWASLFQGHPVPRGAAVFGDATTYEQLPNLLRFAIGVDLSYAAKSKSDFSVAVVMAQELAPTKRCFLVDVIRVQEKAGAFKKRLVALHGRFPTAHIRFYGNTVEQGSADLMEAEPDGVPMRYMLAVGDKFVRAQPYAAAWARGDVLVPQDAHRHLWVSIFLDEHAIFTGLKDLRDDQVDAAAAAFDELSEGFHGRVKTDPGSGSRPGLAGQMR